MLVRARYTVAFAVPTVAIYSLYGVEFARCSSHARIRRGWRSATALTERLVSMSESTKCSGRLARRLKTCLLGKLSGVEVLGDLDLHIAQIALAGYPLPLLLLGVS